jgi:hypothetical protein
MPYVPKRPPALAHLRDEAVSQALMKHFGDFVAAARDLGVDHKHLRRLSWHNPRILNAAHERMELFHIGVKSKIIEALHSSSAKRRRWGFDAMFDSYEFRDHPFASARWAAPAQREQAKKIMEARLVLEREAVELVRERAREIELERWRELEGAALECGDRGERLEFRPPEVVASIPGPPPEPKPSLPRWPGPGAPPPLVAGKYQPWEPPRAQALLQREAELEELPRSEPRRRMSRGGYR